MYSVSRGADRNTEDINPVRSSFLHSSIPPSSRGMILFGLDFLLEFGGGFG
jgi:hypothetical protein